MSTVSDHPAVLTLVGTPKEVQEQLRKSPAERVFAVAIEHMRANDLMALMDNLSNVTASMLQVFMQRHERAVLERLADALVPRTPVPARLLREAATLARARTTVLESGDWLTAAEVAKLAGLSPRNPSAQPNKWKKQGQIFAISHVGVDYFPAYGLDADGGYRPVKALAQIIDVLSEKKDAWGMAYWFASDNSFLGGGRPQDLLASAPQRVVDAAVDEVQEIAHG